MNKLVMDVGGSAIKIAVMDDEANILVHDERTTPMDSLEHFLDVICEVYEQYKDQVDGIALSMPGNIDSETGQIYSPGALSYNANVNIIEKLHQRIHVRIAVENDGKSAALAEVWKGKLKDCKDGVVMILGTGIGGGIVINRKVIKGNHFFAGELSFLSVNAKMNGFRDVFAMHGSTTALIMNVAQKKNVSPETLNGIKIFEMIHQKDPIACACLEELCDVLASQIYNLQCLLDPDKILLGGGISKQPILLETVSKKLEEIYTKLPFEIPHAQIDTCEYYNDSNLIGALYHFQQQFKNS